MPTIPTFGPDRTALRTGLDVPDRALDLSGLARAAQAGQEVFRKAQAIAFEQQDILDKEQERARRMAITEYDAMLRDYTNESALKLQEEFKGKAAIENDVRAIVESRFDEKFTEINKEINDPVVRAAVNSLALQHRGSLGVLANRHIMGENEKRSEEAYALQEGSLLRSATQNFDNPAMVEEALSANRASIEARALEEGKSPEWVESRSLLFRSKVRSLVVDRYLANGRDLDAKAYFGAHKGDFTPQALVEMEARLESGSRLGEVQRVTDALLAQPGLSRADALKVLRNTVKDPKTRDMAEPYLRARYNEMDDIKKAELEALEDQAYGHILAGKPVPMDLMAKLPIQSQISVMKTIERFRNPTDDNEAVNEIYEMLATVEGRERFRVLDFFVTYGHRLSPATFKQFKDIQADYKSKGESGPVFSKYKELAEVFDDALVRRGFTTPEKTDLVGQQRMATARAALRRTVEAQKRELAPVEAETLFDDLLSRVVMVKDKPIPLVMLLPEERALAAKTYSPGLIPPEQREQLSFALVANGVRITDERLVRLDIAMQSGGEPAMTEEILRMNQEQDREREFKAADEIKESVFGIPSMGVPPTPPLMEFDVPRTAPLPTPAMKPKEVETQRELIRRLNLAIERGDYSSTWEIIRQIESLKKNR